MGDDGYIRQVDVQRLVDSAVRHQGTIQLPLRPDQYVRHGDVVFRHTFDPVGSDAGDLLHHIEIGTDRTWEDYVAAAVDELIEAGHGTASVAARLREVLADLSLAVPADRRDEIHTSGSNAWRQPAASVTGRDLRR